MILVSPTEHDILTILKSSQTEYRISSICESNGADLVAPTRIGLVGFQRKTLLDLKASILDGRLYRELAQLKSSPIISNSFLILEYTLTHITTTGEFTDATMPRSTLNSILIKVQLTGTFHLHSHSPADTIATVLAAAKYISSPSAERLHRPSAPSNDWGQRGNREFAIYLLQSFPGIGPALASAIYDYFHSVPLIWSVSQEQLMDVEGLGAKTAAKLHAFLSPP